MNPTITLPPPVIDPSLVAPSKWEREYAAFQRLLPQLLVSHRGRFVAIHDENVVEFGGDKITLALKVLKTIGNVDLFVGLVTDEPAPISRSGVRRDVRVVGGSA